MGDAIIKDIRPGQKNINLMFIVLEIGIFLLHRKRFVRSVCHNGKKWAGHFQNEATKGC